MPCNIPWFFLADMIRYHLGRIPYKLKDNPPRNSTPTTEIEERFTYNNNNYSFDNNNNNSNNNNNNNNTNNNNNNNNNNNSNNDLDACCICAKLSFGLPSETLLKSPLSPSSVSNSSLLSSSSIPTTRKSVARCSPESFTGILPKWK